MRFSATAAIGFLLAVCGLILGALALIPCETVAAPQITVTLIRPAMPWQTTLPATIARYDAPDGSAYTQEDVAVEKDGTLVVPAEHARTTVLLHLWNKVYGDLNSLPHRKETFIDIHFPGRVCLAQVNEAIRKNTNFAGMFESVEYPGIDGYISAPSPPLAGTLRLNVPSSVAEDEIRIEIVVEQCKNF